MLQSVIFCVLGILSLSLLIDTIFKLVKFLSMQNESMHIMKGAHIIYLKGMVTNTTATGTGLAVIFSHHPVTNTIIEQPTDVLKCAVAVVAIVW